MVDIEQPESALVIRQELVPVTLGLSAAEAAFVAALLAGEDLAAAVVGAQQESANFDLALMFALLLRGGALHSYHMVHASREITP
jgi:hypothetical protein